MAAAAASCGGMCFGGGGGRRRSYSSGGKYKRVNKYKVSIFPKVHRYDIKRGKLPYSLGKVCNKAKNARENMSIKAIYRYGASETNIDRASKHYEALVKKAAAFADKVEKAVTSAKKKSAEKRDKDESRAQTQSSAGGGGSTEMDESQSSALSLSREGFKRRLIDIAL